MLIPHEIPKTASKPSSPLALLASEERPLSAQRGRPRSSLTMSNILMDNFPPLKTSYKLMVGGKLEDVAWPPSIDGLFAIRHTNVTN
jgi:hypothetical protein